LISIISYIIKNTNIFLLIDIIALSIILQMILICLVFFNNYIRSNFMLGHVLGAITEVPIRFICSSFTSSDALCGTIAVITHDGIVEPVTDAIIYGTISETLSENGVYGTFEKIYNEGIDLNYIAMSCSVIGSLTTSFIGGYFMTTENILYKSAIGMIGGVIGGQVYEYFYGEEQQS
jgi:hypothetical protein